MRTTDRRRTRTATSLARVKLGAYGLMLSSCSTLAEPTEGEPPVCEYCDVGERELRCAIATYLGDIFNSGIGDDAYVCLDPEATDEEKEQACIDACEQYIAGNLIGLECRFEEDEDPFRWSSCVPPEGNTDSGAGSSYECPGWYVPTARVHHYEPLTAGATVTVERGLLDDIHNDMIALYACDDARYVQHSGYWAFERLEPGDLLFELGLREGDRNAVLQGFSPRTGQLTTEAFVLDSIERMQSAYGALVDAEGLRVVVQKIDIEEPWVIWVSIE